MKVNTETAWKGGAFKRVTKKIRRADEGESTDQQY